MSEDIGTGPTALVERVARAIRLEITGRDDGPIENDGGHGYGRFTDLARVAIAAMREATPEMLKAGGAAEEAHAIALTSEPPGDGTASIVIPSAAEAIWPAMIDAALSKREARSS